MAEGATSTLFAHRVELLQVTHDFNKWDEVKDGREEETSWDFCGELDQRSSSWNRIWIMKRYKWFKQAL